jgi:uncharacterized protein with HEPN domain
MRPCMSPERNWSIRVADILACIEKIKTYTHGMTFEQFSIDGKTVDAVIRNLEIIGEAAGLIPQEIQEEHSEITWLEMRAMRNIIAHEYFGVSLPIIWRTIEQDLPTLAESLGKLLNYRS